VEPIALEQASLRRCKIENYPLFPIVHVG